MSANQAVSELSEFEGGDDIGLLNFLISQGAIISAEREGGLVECRVPADLIDSEEVAVDVQHAESLAAQMRDLSVSEHGTGQQARINVALVPGQSLLKIIDGFHRNAALRINGQTMIDVTAKATNWDGLYDQRIFDAKKHPHLRFSRVVQWMREIWAISGLESEGMALEQAILMYRYDFDGARLGFTPEQAALAKQWVASKEKQWDIAAMTIHGQLKVAEHVDPKLVHATREKKRGDLLEAPTQAILKIFSEKIPDNFPLQSLVMQAAKENNLGGPYVSAVCDKVMDCKTIDDAIEVIDAIDWDNLDPAYRTTTDRALRQAYDARTRGALVLRNATSEIAGVIRRAELVVERGEPITPEMHPKILEAIQRSEDLITDLGTLIGKLSDFVREEVPPDPGAEDDQPTPGPKEDAADAGSSEGDDPVDTGTTPDPEKRAAAPTPAKEKKESLPPGMGGLETTIWDRMRENAAAEDEGQSEKERIERDRLGDRVFEAVRFLKGDGPAPADTIAKKELQTAWREIFGMKEKPAGWQERFKALQPGLVAANRAAEADRRIR